MPGETVHSLGRSREAFQAAGQWIVDRADILLAVWDGQPARSMGGTTETVEYARARRKQVVLIAITR